MDSETVTQLPFRQDPFTHVIAHPQKSWGNAQRNFALEQIQDGFVYVLDDDNLMHPDFYSVTSGILNDYPAIECIFYSQVINKTHSVRAVNPDTIRVNFIDQAQFLISRKLIGDLIYEHRYEADGVFIEKLYAASDKKIFYFYNDKAITYYNALV